MSEFATKLGDPKLIPGIHMLKEENQFLKVFFFFFDLNKHTHFQVRIYRQLMGSIILSPFQESSRFSVLIDSL